MGNVAGPEQTEIGLMCRKEVGRVSSELESSLLSFSDNFNEADKPFGTLFSQHNFHLVPSVSRLAPLAPASNPDPEVVDRLTGPGESERDGDGRFAEVGR